MHIVSEGDTLWDLSKKYNIEIDELLRMNSINKRFISSTWSATNYWQ